MLRKGVPGYPYYSGVTGEPMVMESPHKNARIADEKLGCAATKKVACYLLTPIPRDHQGWTYGYLLLLSLV